VALKVAVVVLFIALGWAYINSANYSPYIPPRVNDQFGWAGILTGAGIVFFAFIGFDAFRRPRRKPEIRRKTCPLASSGRLYFAPCCTSCMRTS
jgi:APA family basic amino acid/polyamine antiporter